MHTIYACMQHLLHKSHQLALQSHQHQHQPPFNGQSALSLVASVQNIELDVSTKTTYYSSSTTHSSTHTIEVNISNLEPYALYTCCVGGIDSDSAVGEVNCTTFRTPVSLMGGKHYGNLLIITHKYYYIMLMRESMSYQNAHTKMITLYPGALSFPSSTCLSIHTRIAYVQG